VFYKESAMSGKGGKAGGGISAGSFVFKANIGAELNSNTNTTSKKAISLPITPQTLVSYFGEMHAIWVIEDFHKMDAEEKTKLSQVMKIFMDQSSQYKTLKIIAVGAVNTAREVVQYDPEMKNRVAEIQVPLMTIEELEEIIKKGNKILNFSFSNEVIRRIANYSSGLASVTHQLSLLICESEEIKQTLRVDKKADDKTLDVAIDEYINEHADSLKLIYDTATTCKHRRKFDRPEEILKAILNNKKDTSTIREISKHISKKYPDYKDNNLRKYVNELTTSERGEILRYDKDSDTYFFSTPFLKAYCFCKLDKKYEASMITTLQMLENLKTTLHEKLEEEYNQFLDEFYDDAPAYFDDD
jgi:hypothetical protein